MERAGVSHRSHFRRKHRKPLLEASGVIRALEVKPREGLRIWLRFSDGSAGEVDLSDLVGRGVFRAWDRVDRIVASFGETG